MPYNHFKYLQQMTNNTQIRTKRISFILALLVIAYVAVDTYLFTYHQINTTTITTPVIIGLVVTILLCGLLQRFFYTWLTKNPINFSFDQQSPTITDSGFEINTDCADEIQTIEQPNNSVIDNYDTIRENIKKKEAEKQVDIIRKTKCFDFWERNVLFPKTKRSFFRTPKHPLPCPFPLNFSLLIITKKFGNLAKNRYICIV